MAALESDYYGMVGSSMELTASALRLAGQSGEASLLRKVAFTVYPVSNMASARAFYEKALGLVSTASGASPWVEYDLPGGGCFAITTALSDTPSATAGGTIAFEVDHIEALVAGLKKKGIRLAQDTLIKGPRCRMAVCFDPDGNSVLLHQLDA